MAGIQVILFENQFADAIHTIVDMLAFRAVSGNDSDANLRALVATQSYTEYPFTLVMGRQ